MEFVVLKVKEVIKLKEENGKKKERKYMTRWRMKLLKSPKQHKNKEARQYGLTG